MSIKPMRGFKLEPSQYHHLPYPILGQPKIDGIRCIVLNNVALSNTLKPIRNVYVQNLVQRFDLNGVDGELTCGSNFQDSSSGIMSTPGNPDFTFHIFDIFDSSKPFKQRLSELELKKIYCPDERVQLIQSIKVNNQAELENYALYNLNQGYEGSIFRSPLALYKYGRSTLRECALLKDKPFEDAEAQIIGFVEQEENLNVQTKDARGYSTRSSHKDNKQGKGTLGAFLVQAPGWGEFSIGTGKGLTDHLRQDIWNNQDKYLHQIITFTYQKYGTKDKPRIPIFKNFRHPEDTLVMF